MPNVQIMKDLGASEELIGYIRETPWNTNLGMLAAYGCEPGGDTDTVTITFVVDADMTPLTAVGDACSEGTCIGTITNPLVVPKGTIVKIPTCAKYPNDETSCGIVSWADVNREEVYYTAGETYQFDEDTAMFAEPHE